MISDLPTNPSTPPTDPVPGPLRAALERKEFTRLTAVQEAVAAAASESVDLRISSQTGSGKTVALGILLARRLFEEHAPVANSSPRALVITPTRELAAQVKSELEWLYADLPNVTVTVVTGGTNVGREQRALRRGRTIVVGTPGRMLDHLNSGALDCSAVGEVVLDEADQMLDMGFREELEAILDGTPSERGTHLVSATFPAAIKRLAERYQGDYLHVEGTRLGEVNGDIEHIAHLVHGSDRYAALVNLLLLAGHQRTLVFVNTRKDTVEIATRLAEDGFSAMPLSGELQQSERTRTLNAFRDGIVHVLIATDVAARGLDIPEVDTVIQAGTPIDSDVYVHRSGRTGRAGRKGRSLLLVPTAYEYRVRELFERAKVDARWCDIPGASRVRKKLAKRGQRQLLQWIDGAEPASESQLEFARLLLEGRDPEQVVAALASRAAETSAREPIEIEAPRPGKRPKGGAREWSAGEGRRGGRFGRSKGSGGSGASRGRGDYVRFSINWGFRGGANPRRLMALICRRGEITGRSVGAIDPGPQATTFEVDRSVAGDFEAKAQRPDKRDPRLVIRRV